MLIFFIGLLVGAVVGIATMCIVMMGKAEDRLDVNRADRPELSPGEKPIRGLGPSEAPGAVNP
jgi:hypothetical protein